MKERERTTCKMFCVTIFLSPPKECETPGPNEFLRDQVSSNTISLYYCLIDNLSRSLLIWRCMRNGLTQSFSLSLTFRTPLPLPLVNHYFSFKISKFFQHHEFTLLVSIPPWFFMVFHVYVDFILVGKVASFLVVCIRSDAGTGMGHWWE